MAEELKIYAELLSQPCRSVVAFCEHSKVPYALIPINLLEGEHETAEFARMNPLKEIPTIAHGDYYLNESAAIVVYIADAFGVDNDWYPKDIQIRGRINAYLHLHHTFARQACRDYFFHCLVAPKYFGYPQPAAEERERLRRHFEEFFGLLEAVVGDTGFIARTQKMTIADVFAYSEIVQTSGLGIQWERHPKAKQWFDMVGNDEVVSRVHERIKEAVARGI
jgi:glutathione S-transferase